MAFVQDIFIFIGRLMLFLFVAFTIIFAIAESASRSKDQSSQASISPWLNKTLNEIVLNLNSDPIEDFSLLLKGSCPANYHTQTLYRWQTHKFCHCANKILIDGCPSTHTTSKGDVIRGDDGGLLRNCRETEPKEKHLNTWRGIKVCTKKLKDWKAMTYNSTLKTWGCLEGYGVCNSTKICGLNSSQGLKCPIAEIIRARDEMSLKQLKGIHPMNPHPFKLAGQFNDEKNKDMVFYNGEGAHFSQPFINFQVGLENLCLNSSVEEKWGDSFQILKIPRTGCQAMGVHPKTMVLDRNDESEFYLHNKMDELNSLPGYKEFIYGSQAILFGVKRFNLKQKAGCEKAHELKAVEYDNDPGNLNELRSTSNIIVFTSIGLFVIILIIYFLVMKKPHAGFFIAYTLHIICIALAASQLALGILSFQNIKRMQRTNSVIYDIGAKECFEEKNVNEVFRNFTANLKLAYGNQAYYADWSVVISVTYLTLVLIYGMWLASTFKCSKDLKVDEEDEKEEKEEGKAD